LSVVSVLTPLADRARQVQARRIVAIARNQGGRALARRVTRVRHSLGGYWRQARPIWTPGNRWRSPLSIELRDGRTRAAGLRCGREGAT
jgi:hypothetical protein